MDTWIGIKMWRGCAQEGHKRMNAGVHKQISEVQVRPSHHMRNKTGHHKMTNKVVSLRIFTCGTTPSSVGVNVGE